MIRRFDPQAIASRTRRCAGRPRDGQCGDRKHPRLRRFHLPPGGPGGGARRHAEGSLGRGAGRMRSEVQGLSPSTNTACPSMSPAPLTRPAALIHHGSGPRNVMRKCGRSCRVKQLGKVATYWMMGSMAAFVVCFLVSLVAIFRTIVELRQEVSVRSGELVWASRTDGIVFREQRNNRSQRIARLAIIGCVLCIGSASMAMGLSYHYGWLPPGETPNSVSLEFK
jgi:hypothetical protein